MCGLVGIISTEGYKNAKKRGELLAEGLMANMWRGWQSTGIAIVPKDRENHTPVVYKDELCAFDFVHRPYVHRVLDNMEKYTAIIGHTRSATTSSVSERNAHPFQYNHITMVHNGHIHNAYDLTRTYKTTELGITVDSDHVAYALGNVGEKEDEEDVLEQLKGDFALVWHNSKDGTINIARNEGRPFYFAWVEKENTMVWTSELTMLVHLMERRGMDIDGVCYEPEPNAWYKFPIGEVRGVTKRPFVPRPRPNTHLSVVGPTRTDTGSGTGANEEFTEPTPAEMDQARMRMASLGRIDVEDEEQVKEYLQRIKPRLKRCSGHPTTIAKIKAAGKRLEALGFYFNKTDVMMMRKWSAYKNNKSRGNILGSTLTGFPCIMHDVPMATYDKYRNYNKVHINMINLRKLDSGVTAIVCTEHIGHDKMYEKWLMAKAGMSDEGVGTDRPFLGPGGRYISEARWKELTDKGCGYCDGHINPRFHVKTYWMQDTPICLECQQDAEFWMYNGEVDKPVTRIAKDDGRDVGPVNVLH